MKVGIAGYGAYIPRFRIRVEDIARVWGADARTISSSLRISEKAVPAMDEDTATIAVEAARYAIRRAGIGGERVGAVYVGSESHPYAVKPTATIVAEAIGATPELTAADYEFACKAGTAAVQTCMGLVGTGMVEYALAIGADTAQGAPGDALEYTAAAGGAAFVIASENLLARVEGTYSYTTDTPDFWRREGQAYPRHGGRFTGMPAYFKHVCGAAEGLMRGLGLEPEDFTYAVFHQPNGKFPRVAARRLGFTEEQVEPGIIVDRVGNTYSGSSLLGLAKVLDVAQPGDRVLVASFGSGAGSDALSIVVESPIEERRQLAPSVEELIARKRYIGYAEYAKLRRKIKV